MLVCGPSVIQSIAGGFGSAAPSYGSTKHQLEPPSEKFTPAAAGFWQNGTITHNNTLTEAQFVGVSDGDTLRLEYDGKENTLRLCCNGTEVKVLEGLSSKDAMDFLVGRGANGSEEVKLSVVDDSPPEAEAEMQAFAGVLNPLVVNETLPSGQNV